MKTAWLLKYPRVPGAGRHNAYYVSVEVIRAETKVSRVTEFGFRNDPEEAARRGLPTFERRVVVGTKDVAEAGFVVRDNGRAKWVPAASLFAVKPAPGKAPDRSQWYKAEGVEV